MKRSFLSFLTTSALLALTTTAWAAPTVTVDGQALAFDVPPIIENGRTLVPVRAISTALGANVNWDVATQTVIIQKADNNIRLPLGGQATKNGNPMDLDVPAKIIQDRTMVPLRFVSEALGCHVVWHDSTQTIAITAQAEPQSPSTATKTIDEKDNGKTITRFAFLTKLIKETDLNLNHIRFIKAPVPSDYVTDVPQEASYAHDVVIAGHYNIIDIGQAFRPDDAITREEAALWLVKALESKKGSLMYIQLFQQFRDADQIAPERMTYVQRASIMKLVTADQAGNFHPQDRLSPTDEASLWIQYRVILSQAR
ncbi:copper amine oxidase N-terminal domain-containing protein [Heliophilum fasciatum]|uniref:S-layer family protein n=1 Tax=Heliophilum fasciatum TaxID=35700 RepID=Q0Q0I6_9FIRM|nr:copper amine oxidase N-terminal domain-containing protein [Heliophilum fasciatum]ABG57078.2 hypothetical protein [Heliophilum fasciatum]MCW2278476.1 hypothetical protein [Heliophilum fasciatum]TCP63607.1 S-layer family protein [Heliophilum fasciatum]